MKAVRAISPVAAITAVVLTLAAANVAAQQNDPRSVMPERPTVATHAGTVAPGFLEFEWGAEFSAGPDVAIPLYFKLGLTRRLQLGLLEVLGDPGANSLTDLLPPEPPTLALKWRVADANPLLGAFAVQPSAKFGTASGQRWEFGVLLISSHQLGNVALDLNAGVTAKRGSDATEVWTISLGGPMNGKWGWVGELSGLVTSNGSSTQLLAGPTYRWRKSFTWDAGVIVSLDEFADNTRFYFGGTTNLGRIIGK